MLPSCHGRYPNNPVLRVLTPRDTCRNLAIYPVKLTQVSMLNEVRRAWPPAIAYTACKASTSMLGLQQHDALACVLPD